MFPLEISKFGTKHENPNWRTFLDITIKQFMETTFPGHPSKEYHIQNRFSCESTERMCQRNISLSYSKCRIKFTALINYPAHMMKLFFSLGTSRSFICKTCSSHPQLVFVRNYVIQVRNRFAICFIQPNWNRL